MQTKGAKSSTISDSVVKCWYALKCVDSRKRYEKFEKE